MTTTHSKSVFGSCFQRYICLKLSIESIGRSFTVFPRWYSGCVNFEPSAVRKFTLPAKQRSLLLNITFCSFDVFFSFSCGKEENRDFPTVKTIELQYVLFSAIKLADTTLRNFSGVSVSSGAWNRIMNGRPSSVNSCQQNKSLQPYMLHGICKDWEVGCCRISPVPTSAFSKVISLTKGTHLSVAHWSNKSWFMPPWPYVNSVGLSWTKTPII